MKNSARLAGSVLAFIAGLMMPLAGSVLAQESTPGVEPPVTIGQTEVAWGEGWNVDTESSMQEQITLMWLNEGEGLLGLATYGEFVDETVESAEDALDTFASAYFEGAELEGVTARDAGELDNGAIWKVYDFELDEDLPFTMVITVAETEDQMYTVSTLTGNAGAFASIVEQAQQDITLDGEPQFLAGVDGEALVSPASTPIASPEATPAA